MQRILSKTALQLVTRVINNTTKRTISQTKNLTSAYEGEGKTTVTILNSESDLGLLIDGISQVGFRLNNDTTVLGPMLIFPRLVFSWMVKTHHDINEESLVMFTMMEPKPDLLILGVGSQIKDPSIHHRLYPISRKLKINMEVLPTEKACATFNFLNAEGRFVGAALIPPEEIEASDDDEYNTKIHYQDVMKLKWESIA